MTFKVTHLPNFRTYSVFLVSNFLSLSTGRWEFYVSIFVILYVCIYFVLDWYPWFGARLWVTVDFFLQAQKTFYFFYWFMLGALLIVKVIFNILSKQRVKVFVWFSPRCGDIATKNVCLHFFYSTHPVTKKIDFFFFARFYFYMYISCSLDCSIYHWKLVIHQSIKNKYSFKKN